jgi:precorrin-6B methylase 1
MTTSLKHISSVELAAARARVALGNTSVSARRSAMMLPESQSYDDIKALFLMESMTDNWKGQVK